MEVNSKELLLALDMVHSDIYCKIVLMKVQGHESVLVSETDLACQLGILQSVMKKLGDLRELGPYPPLPKGGSNANKNTDSQH